MAFAVTSSQRNALMGNHEMFTSCAILRGSSHLLTIPPDELIDVRISATMSTRGGRDGQITVTQNILDKGYLNPMSDQVIISTGIPNLVSVPIFTGKVDAHDASDGLLVNVPLLSRGAEAIRASFESPWAAVNGNQASNEIARILNSIDPNWGVDTTAATLSSPIGNGLVWEQDPGQALDQIAQGSSLIWQPDRVGSFVVYNNPYAVGSSLGANPVVTFRDGERGTTVHVAESTTREGIYNSVTIVTERVNNSEPIRVTVRDATTGSPTFWGPPGLFGKQNLVVKNQTPITEAAALALAIRILRQSLSLQRAWIIETPHMPLLDPGDVFSLWYRDQVTAQVVESIAYSGRADQLTRITSRELRLIESVEVVS
jgi:hypothetical protein